MTDTDKNQNSFEEPQPLLTALNSAREAIQSRWRVFLFSHNLTAQQWRVIMLLYNNNKIEVIRLAKMASLLQPSISRILSTLHKRGLINRQINTKDKRRNLISLSSKGIDLHQKIRPISRDIYEKMEEEYGSERISELIKLLKQFTDILGIVQENEEI